MAPDQQRTTPQGRRIAQHPGHVPGAENSAATASIAGVTGAFEVQKAAFLFGF
jgi:hypothetical protein